MPKVHLTDSMLRNYPLPSKKQKRILLHDDHLIKDGRLFREGVRGLSVRVSYGGSKTFYVSYWDSQAGYPSSIDIGKYPMMGIMSAREKTKEILDLHSSGFNPKREIEKRKEDRPITLERYAKKFEDQYCRMNLKASTLKDYKSRLKKIVSHAPLARKPMTDITRGDIRSYLRSIAVDHPINANRVQSVLSKMFNEAVEDGLIQENPIRKLAKMGKEKSRDIRYTNDEISGIWHCVENEYPTMKNLVRFLLLTGQRTGETCLMKWTDIDTKNPFRAGHGVRISLSNGSNQTIE
jgi:hypothetical protein